MGFDFPNMKSFVLLKENGKFATSRHVVFDESAPPASDSRADFSHHLKHPHKVITQQKGQSNPPNDDISTDSEESAQQPAAQPPAATPADASQSQQNVLNPAFHILHHLPQDCPYHRKVLHLLLLSGSRIPSLRVTNRIPQGPRWSQRSNLGVIDRYDPGAYAAFTKKLPTTKNVGFDPDPTESVFRPQCCPQNLIP
jgi:hypothetical protein